MAPISIDIAEIAKANLVMKFRIVGARRFNLRVKAAVAIMAFAVWISPGTIVMELDDEARA